ncbi:hypothetical protein [Kitasatospora cathayae]|uniref:Uncharacterized protein n=1 Tax=Kitasatospora cathayae TaxID=3004092 RepID=A0ABY7Q2X4_9ACTN|nr:hypothetical protein [Kitasatospora sp. HUAS 3-15]WBP87031.1 hypothetical protein O1G21_15055 [Kitasatospora sp. HUAS 3-15]
MKVSEFAKRSVDRGVYVVGRVGKGKTLHILDQWAGETLCRKRAEKIGHLLETDDRTLCVNCDKNTIGATKTMADYPAPDLTNIPGLNITTEGETEVPKTETAETPETTQEQIQEQITANIERVRSLAEADNEEGAAEIVKETKSLIDAAKGASSTATNKLRKGFRDELEKAMQAKPAEPIKPSKEVVPVVKYEDIEGVSDLVRMGAAMVSEGIAGLAKSSDVADKVGAILLDMWLRIENPKTGCSDLRGDSDEAKRASKDMYAAIEEELKGNPDGAKILDSYKRQIQRRRQHRTVEYVRALDNSPEEHRHFAKALEANPDLSPSEAVRKVCRIAEKSEIEKTLERDAAKRQLKNAQKALESGKLEGEEAEEAKKIVAEAAVPPVKRAMAAMDKAEKSINAALDLAGELGEVELLALKQRIETLVNGASERKAKL